MAFFVFAYIIFVSIFFYKYRILQPKELSIYPENIIIDRFFYFGVPILTISILIGFRYNVGVDYPIYKEIYESLTSINLNWSLKNSGVEPLFTVLCVLLHKLNIPYYGMFFVMTVLPLCFFYSFLNRNKFLTVPAIIFVYMSGVFFWYMNIMRHGISFFILLYSLKYIINRSFFKYLLCVIIASGFHITSLLYIPLYILVNFDKALFSRYLSIILYFITWIFSKSLISFLFLLATPFLEGRYMKYINVLEDWEMSGGSGLGVLVLHISDIMLIYLSTICLEYFKKERFDIYYNIFLVGVFISNIAGMNMLLSRLPFSFVSMRFIIASFSVCYIYKHWKITSARYKVAALICVLCYLAYFIGNVLSLDYKFIPL